MLSPTNLARRIEHTLFAPDATRQDIEKLCAGARQHGFHGVCVNGSRVELAHAVLEESVVQLVALVGFPLGAADADAKRYETETAIDQGAQEIDFVLNLGRLKDGDQRAVLREMRDIVEAAAEWPVKVILEMHLLTREKTIFACECALDSGVQFVCTSTGFHTPAVTVEQVKLLREIVGAEFGVKAVGGIRDAEMAQALIEAGATRIGTTDGVAVVGGAGR